MPNQPAKPDRIDPDRWVLTLIGTEGTPSVAVRVRRLLKVAARLGLRCVRVAGVEPIGTADGASRGDSQRLYDVQGDERGQG